MGVWNSFCTICGGPLYSDLIEKEGCKKFLTPTPEGDFTWLNDLRAINSVNGLSQSCHMDGFGPEIQEKDNSEMVYRPLNEDDLHDEPYDDEIPSAMVHEKCLKIFEDLLPDNIKELNKKELFMKMRPHLDADNMNAQFEPGKVDYAPIDIYQEQFFSYEDTEDCKQLLSDPEKPCGKQNLERIQGIVKDQIIPLLNQT